MVEVNRALARKVLEIVDKGLCDGMGDFKPGKMCVEAAVCYAMGLEHSDDPPCVERAIRDLKIALNDCGLWSTNKNRAKGLRRLAIAQLGSNGVVKGTEFEEAVIETLLKKYVPEVLKIVKKDLNSEDRFSKYFMDDLILAISDSDKFISYIGEAYDGRIHLQFKGKINSFKLLETVNRITNENGESYDYYEFFCAFGKQANKKLVEFCEDVVQILVRLKSPGAKWLDLTNA